MKICFLIPDGVGIRNYLYSDLLKKLHQDGHQITIWHALNQQVVDLSATLNGFVPNQTSFSILTEDFLTQLLRESTTFARLRHNHKITGNPTLMLNWHEKRGSFKRKALITISEWLGKTFNNYQSVQAVEEIYFSRLKKTSIYQTYRAQLKEINPDVLICTHQRYPGAAYAMAAAEDMGIETVSAIFSWDNLPKARLPLRAKYYTVWSRHMADELRFYYPEIKENQIWITGTPQFDFYRDQSILVSRQQFAAQFGLDPSKHWVCFSGCDTKTSPFDADYLKDVALALQDQKDIQLIFRQVPVETVDRYRKVLQDHPEIIHLNPLWHKGSDWSQFFPLPEDIAHLVNLSFHCATVVNIGSTMALDFSWYDSPGLYLRYDHRPDQKWSVAEVYEFQHFKSMGSWDAVVWADSQQDILKKIRQIIDEPSVVAKDRRHWLNRIIEPDPQFTASEKLASKISQLQKETLPA